MKRIFLYFAIAGVLISPAVHAACTSPPGSDESFEWDETTHTWTYCDGTTWKNLREVDDSGSGVRTRIQIANDTGSCTAAKLGRLRYDGTSTWEYCDGTTWQALASGGSTAAAGNDREIQFNSGGVLGSNANFTYTANGRLLIEGPQTDSVVIGGGNETSTGTENTYIGKRAGAANTSGWRNVMVGEDAGKANTSGAGLVFIGARTGLANTTGWYNTFLGFSAGSANTTGESNIAIGWGALDFSETGDRNVIIGTSAGLGVASSSNISDNTFVGFEAAKNILTGANNNVIIGKSAAGTLTTGASNIIIGTSADVPAAGTSNHLNIGGTIYGDLSTDKVGIGTTTPESTLHVPDGKYFQAEDNNAGAPPAADCDTDAERGRQSIDTTNNLLYVCNGATRGWDYVALSD